ncbi:1-deoxy-D-xylulose-5-phosphate synthase [Vogesella indigofera]|uniref:1-deoxy-D-xylulose-5-phosphate synthase n=1 Tax=Vogesella indigofera TaxID=45465 RepID=A0ABT5I2T1_VOGIN|nr:1-deoxy-D-xylulose-5-phosphate synthase [Vogesella indigofera]MDC7690428.1 1-deoxy-D-xylulose-5-phosphate synthase [Vogesella indigofera]
MTTLLDTIHSPADLRQLKRSDLPQLARELREFIVESVSKTGGHFASNLGSVELTVALHYVFNTPDDRLVWDVGHQTYPHKILTGRRERMGSMRQQGGLAGFPKRDESEYDTFGVGHSSTSIGAALGMAVAAQLQGIERHCVAIIGDGSMTAGQAFEALNNAGAMDTNLLVILNDNDMSISPNVGALNNYLAKIMSGRFYAAVRQGSNKVLGGIAPPLRDIASKVEEHVKGFFTPGTLFEEFGFNYIGPIDGHDVDVLTDTLNNIKSLKGPQFLHIVTKKGQGYKLAENDPVKYHGVTKFDPANGLVGSKSGGKPQYTQVFGDWICDMAKLDSRLVGITPAMREGSGLVRFEQEYPQRYFDVAIAEQHAVTFAAGLACDGLKPVVAIYSTFLQRAYDQLIHDVALQNLPVVFAIDRAGLVGADGPTHAGSFDLSFLRCIPNMTVMAPSDENECRQMLYTAFTLDGPSAVRYPRGTGPGAAIVHEMSALPIGKGHIRRQGQGKVAILAFGSMVTPALQAAEAFDATVADMRFVKPLDAELVKQLAASHELIVTVEENAIMGGAGSACGEVLAAANVQVPLLHLGLPDDYVEHGDPAMLLAGCGLDAAGIEASIAARLGR